MFDGLDYIYMPSRDVAADVAYFTDVLGGRLVFAIDGMGARVAMIELTDSPPRILLADHLEGDRPVLVYRVEDLERASKDLRARGWDEGHALEIPQGPVRSFAGPGVAIDSRSTSARVQASRPASRGAATSRPAAS